MIRDAAGVDVTAALPELAGLAVRVAARSAILDGELVVVDGAGRADRDELARRLRGEPGRPVAFLAFDLLHLDGRALISQPLVRRREALRRVLRPGDEVVAVPAIATEGIALFEAVVAQGMAGILARQRQSPYLPGVRSRLWRFIAATPGAGAAAEGLAEVPLDVPGPAAAPVLALISRLPLEDCRRSAGLPQALRAAATNARSPGRVPYSSTPGRVHPRRHDRDDRDGRDQQPDRQQRPATARRP